MLFSLNRFVQLLFLAGLTTISGSVYHLSTNDSSLKDENIRLSQALLDEKKEISEVLLVLRKFRPIETENIYSDGTPMPSWKEMVDSQEYADLSTPKKVNLLCNWAINSIHTQKSFVEKDKDLQESLNDEIVKLKKVCELQKMAFLESQKNNAELIRNVQELIVSNNSLEAIQANQRSMDKLKASLAATADDNQVTSRRIAAALEESNYIARMSELNASMATPPYQSQWHDFTAKTPSGDTIRGTIMDR